MMIDELRRWNWKLIPAAADWLVTLKPNKCFNNFVRNERMIYNVFDLSKELHYKMDFCRIRIKNNLLLIFFENGIFIMGKFTKWLINPRHSLEDKIVMSREHFTGVWSTMRSHQVGYQPMLNGKIIF